MITGLYAGILGLIFIFLTIRVVKFRRRLQISLGAGENNSIEKHIRVHGNFIEYVPFGILMILMLEIANMPAFIIHGLGTSLVIGRVLHAYSIGKDKQWLLGRVLGMLLTLLVLTISSVTLIGIGAIAYK